ncbi:chitin synthase [Elysia marginata]|uniref:Chitin synthase n=1 Tax=Elysia marginata TaxID=1093978 RepID=A0AAV4GXQ9_9GAST|nr:chitin synthase [Elysia marginata]
MDTGKMMEPKLMNSVEWDEASDEDQPYPKLSAAERVLNKTSAIRNSQRVRKTKSANEDDKETEKFGSGRSKSSTGQLDLSKMDKDKLRELGFPVRLLFEDFISRYKIIVFSAASDVEPTAEHCRFIAKRADLKEYEISDCKILLSYADVARLNKLRRDEEKKIIRAQAHVRGYLVRSRSGKLQPPGPTVSVWDDSSAPESRRSSDGAWFANDHSPCSTLSTRTGGSTMDGNSFTPMMLPSPVATSELRGLNPATKSSTGRGFDTDHHSTKIFHEHLQDTLQKLEAKSNRKVIKFFTC